MIILNQIIILVIIIINIIILIIIISIIIINIIIIIIIIINVLLAQNSELHSKIPSRPSQLGKPCHDSDTQFTTLNVENYNFQTTVHYLQFPSHLTQLRF